MIVSYFSMPKNLVKRLLSIFAFLFIATASYGQAVDDFQTNGNVTFAAATNWQRWNGSAWVAAAAAPTTAANVVTVRNANTAVVGANVSLDQLVVATGAILTVNSGNTLTIANGAGTDLSVDGTVNNSGTITPTGTIAFNANSNYNHTRNGGAIPVAAWAVTSTCNITGIVGTALTGGWNQSFGNFTWNCTGQTTNQDFANTFTTVTGDITIVSTNSSNLRLTNNGNYTLTVGGNINIQGGTLDISRGNGVATINLSGNYSQSGGTFTESGGSTTSSIILVKSGTQTFTKSGGTISNTLNFTVNSGSILDMGTSVLNGSGNFTLSSGAGIITKHSQGISTTAGTGCIQVSGTKSYNTGADYTFNGTAAQVTGNGLPANVHNLTINNSFGVSLTGSVSVNGILDLQVGAVQINGQTLTINGALSRTGVGTGTITGSATSSLSVAGTGAFADFYFTNATENLLNLTIDRTGSTINLGSDLTIAGILALTNAVITAPGKTVSLSNTAAASLTAGLNSYIEGGISRAMINAGGTYIFPSGVAACGSHWLTFSSVSGTAPVMKVTFACSGAITGDATIASPMPININWHLEKASGTFSDATVKLDASEIDFTNTVAQSSLQAGIYSKVSSIPAAGSLTASSIGSIAADKWLAVGSSTLKTYYSYQTGSWNTPASWTLDPSGTTQIGSAVPASDDFVTILTGRTITLPGNIASTGLDITIEEGGVLDLSTWQFTAGLSKLSGQGTLVISSGVFPTPVTTNTFINAGGGTTEYRTSINLPSQATYNNLTINATGLTVTQTIDLTLNGNLYIKTGTFRLNDDTQRRLKLTVYGDVAVDAGAFWTVGTGVTNSTTTPTGITGGTAPFINYYDQQSHRVVLYGNFTNNGTVRFTNLTYPVFNAFPPVVLDATSGFATVYFQGASNSTLLCSGTTDFYNLVLDKGIDQTFKLTVYTSGSSSANFRLFGADIAGGDGGGANPNLKKALWIRTGTLVLEGLTTIPSLTEGNASEGGADPNSDFYIPSNGALVLNGTDVAVFSTADDYREVNLVYNTSAPNNAAMGISTGGTGCSLSLYGKLQVNNGYLSTRESGGIITSSVSPGQFILNNGTVDAKQFLGSTGSASYQQNGGLFVLRGRFQRTFTYSTIANLIDASAATLYNVRAANGISGTFGTFNLNNASNVFSMSGGTIRIYDVCGDGSSAAQQKAFDIISSASNSNVTGGTLEIDPLTGSVPANDSPNFLISSNAKLGSLIINRASGTSTVLLNTYPLILLNNLTLTSGALSANNLDVTIGGNVTVQSGTSYTTGTNTTILNGISTQVFTVNLASPLSLNKFTIDKAAGSIVNFAGTQTVININDNFRLASGTINDNGNTINVYKNVFNSGLHTGNGKIAFIGTVAQIIDGNGIFNNVELDNNTAVPAPVSLSANITINGTLTLSRDKLFNIGIYNLKLNSSASIVNGGTLRYIQTAGNSGDGGLTKVYSSTTAFLFPVGAPTITPVRAVKYTPATIGFNSAPATYGSITVIPVGYEHPATTVNGQSLTYFWSIKSTGFVGIPANSVTHSFVYDQIDVAGTETNYTPSVYNRLTFTWNNGLPANINTTSNTISDWSSPANSMDFLDGDYTAGDNATGGGTFGTPLKFYSRASSAWNLNTTWSYTSGGPAVPAGAVAGVNYPGPNSIVIIENANRVNLTAVHTCASLQISAGSVLDIYTYATSVFSMVLSYPSGNNGLFRLTTTVGSPKVFSFPSGDFSDFNVNRGTTEFYDIDGATGAEYILPANVTSYGNLILTAKGGDNLILPNNSYTTINGDLTCTGDLPTAWVTMSWLTAGVYTPVVEKTVHVTGNMFINNGTFLFLDDQAPQHLIVDGNVTIAPTAVFDTYNNYPVNNGAAPRLNSFDIGGSFINNSNVNPSARFINGNNYVNLNFFGNTSASITSTGGATPTTILNKVTINKGNSQTATLTCDIGGTLTTPNDNWLTLQNGTFRYMRTNPGSDFTISRTSSFTIPPTAGLYIDYSNTGNRNILISDDNTVNTNDVFLNGKLTLIRGNVYVGQIAAPAFNNDIEYSAGGASEIDISGGNLVVNGQIRQNVSSTAGILKYKQSGGTVTINGNAANTSNAKLEILNSGEFTMSAGTITILRGGGGSAYGDLYLRPGSGSVTGGDIIFFNNLSGSNQQYLLDATLPLNNLTITGRTTATAATATVKLMVNPLELNGNLTLTNAQSILDVNPVYSLPLTVKGNFSNSGAYNHYINLTTFNGGTQSLSGTSSTDFYDLNVSPVTKLTLSKDITVLQNLSIGNGTLECLTYLVNVKGNVANNGTFTNSNSTSGIILNGSSLQHLSGTGTFGQIELNNNEGSVIDNSITLNKDLVLNNGIFDITEYLLTLGQNSSIIPKGYSFGNGKMIISDGVWSNVGILKVFGTPLSTTFTYPLGTPGKYTPAVLTITANGSVGSIRINNINSTHPAMLEPDNVLKYYWEVESIGITALSGNLLLNYKAADVLGGPESSYVAAQLLTPGTNWSKAAPGSGTDNVNETNHTITFNFNNSSNLTGQYTAGNDDAIPSTVPQYTSNRDGNWTDNTIWTPSGGTSYACPVGGPNGFIVTVDHVVTANANYCFTYRTTINNKLKVIAPYFGHNFGSVYGNGTLYLESELFPAGRFGSFLDCSGNGTLEYGGTGTYNINATLFSSVPRIIISGSGSRILPDKDLTICQQLIIDDGGSGSLTLDNSVHNRRLVMNGTFERYNNGGFESGTGSSAVIEFAGTAAQTIGGVLGNFTGNNAFNTLEINNASGLSVNDNGSIEVNGDLLLTNGLISTTSTNKLIINNYSVSCIYPDGGSATSYIDGPLIKKLNQGDPLFKFPVGKKSIGLGNNLSLRSTQTGTLFWSVEYISPNGYVDFSAPLTAVSNKEYWNISGVPGTSQAFLDISWNSSSDLTPLMTQNGLSDMRIAEHNGTDWIEMLSSAVSGSDNYNGSVETSNRAVISSGSRNFTLACINTPKARIKMSPPGPICGTAGIPVTLTTTLAIVAPYTITYTENGIAKSISPATFPATIPTAVTGGEYILTGFTYNFPAGTPQTGVYDRTSVTVYAVPTTAAAGTDQSLCGATSATLAANPPVSGSGLWSIISGTGGTIVTPTIPNSVFNGTNGSTYVLRWTISNGTCISFDDVTVSFPLLAAQPAGFTVSTPVVCQGTNGVIYTVPNDPSVTYNWSYSGSGATFSSITNSLSVDYSSIATSGTLSVTATNSCNTSAPRSLGITVNSTPVITAQPTASAPVCSGNGVQTISVTATGTGLTYSWRKGGIAVVNGGVISGQGTATLRLTNPVTADAGNYDVVITGTCAPAVTSNTVAIVVNGNVWNGSLSTDWNVAGNWSCGFIPDLTTPVQIQNVTNKPILSAGAPGAALNIVIDNGSSLTVTGNTIQISGSITNNGTFDASDGRIELNGSVAQTIGPGIFAGNTIKDLLVNNSAGVTLTGPLGISGTVKAQNGNLSSDGNLTLLSTALQTALVDGSGTGEITGNVTMQRYLPSGFGYKYFSSPFTAATVSEFTDESITLLYRYDENRMVNGTPATGWVNYKVPANILNPLAGYAVNFGSSAVPITVDVTGVLNNGDKSVTLYNHNQSYTQGLNLIGNPYPSPIDWNAAGWTKLNIDNALYFFKASTMDQYGGSYRSYINGFSSDGIVNNIIPSMQGFFVHVSIGSFPVTGTLSMNNSVRSTNLNHAFTKSGTDSYLKFLRLGASFSDDSASLDPMVIYFDENATPGFESDLDALKLLNTDLKIPNLWGAATDGKRLSISALPVISEDSCTIPLGLKLNRAGNIIFRLQDVNSYFAGMKIFIDDLTAGIHKELLPGQEYLVPLDIGEYNNRFFLNMMNLSTGNNDITDKDDKFIIYCSEGVLKAEIGILNGTSGMLRVFNLTGQLIFIEKVYSTGHYEYNTHFADGIYIVTYSTGTYNRSKKIFIHNR
jgi:hypothetical protein